MAWLLFEGTQAVSVTGVVNAIGEHLSLSRSVPTVGNAEDWLVSLENGMQSAVRCVFNRCVACVCVGVVGAVIA